MNLLICLPNNGDLLNEIFRGEINNKFIEYQKLL